MDIRLENYFNNNVIPPDCQGMARTKQTIRKQVNVNHGQPAVNPFVQSNELDSDSSLERAYNAVNKDSNDENMGSKGPGVSSRVSSQCGRSRGLSLDGGDGSGSGQRRRIESESSEEEETPESSKESTEEEEPPKKKPRKSQSPGKPSQKQLVAKLPKKKKPQKREEEMSAKELVAHWNRTARIKKPSVIAQGWLKKTERRRDAQNRLLRRMKPGTKSLKEIRFYQWYQTFLIAVSSFQHLVHEVYLSLDGGGNLRWQSMTLFALQCSTEAYMAGFWHDANLCTLHQKVVTVNHKDVWLATEICGREHILG